MAKIQKKAFCFSLWNDHSDLAGGFSRQDNMLLGHIKHSALSQPARFTTMFRLKNQNSAHLVHTLIQQPCLCLMKGGGEKSLIP